MKKEKTIPEPLCGGQCHQRHHAGQQQRPLAVPLTMVSMPLPNPYSTTNSSVVAQAAIRQIKRS
jgi:hypothetical protein